MLLIGVLVVLFSDAILLANFGRLKSQVPKILLIDILVIIVYWILISYQQPKPPNYITTNSGKQYTLRNLTPGVQQYTDRSYKLLKIPKELLGATLIQTANVDKKTSQQNLFSLKLNTDGPVVIYYIFDKRIAGTHPPEWLMHKRPVKLSSELVTSDNECHYVFFADTISEKKQPLFFGSNQPFAGGKPYKKLEACSMYFAAVSGAAADQIVNVNISEESKRYFELFIIGADSLKFTKKLSDHEAWLRSNGIQGTRLDTVTSGIKNLQFYNADLKQADLSGINIIKTNFKSSVLKYVEFSNTSFKDVNFFNSQLDSANFNQAVLKDCSFTGSDLTGAIFTGVNLKNVDFSGADMAGVIFEPDSVVNIQGIAFAEGLDSITYRTDPGALIELKQRLKQDGFTDAERKVTAAIQRRKNELTASWLARAINYVLFDFTSEYGLKPFHPLIIMLFLIYLFYRVYLSLFFINKLGIVIKHQEPFSEN